MIFNFNNEVISNNQQEVINLNELLPVSVNIGNVSDGYHTFNELYDHRTKLFAVICNNNKDIAWKSRKHYDLDYPMYDGMFIAGINTPNGQATYHCDDPYWDLFNVQELDIAPEYDGHTPADAIERILLLGGN